MQWNSVENDISSFFGNIDIPTVRTVQDTSTNIMGYKLIDFCANNNMYIANSRVSNDKGVEAFTCKSRSTVDYVLLSKELFKILTEFDVLDFCALFSDVHNPISFFISTTQDIT